MIPQLLLFCTGALLLYGGAECVVRKCVSVAKGVGVSSAFLAWTLVAFGTSAPELIVSLLAAIRGSHGVAVGNVVGSNIANIALIVGVCGLLSPLYMRLRSYLLQYLAMLSSFLIFYAFAQDRVINLGEGVLMLLPLPLFFYLAKGREGRSSCKGSGLLFEIILMIVGFFSLFIGAHILVHSTIRICQIMGVPHYVMGASAVAVFTSLPELVTSVVATYRGHVDVCVGNVLGSNLINTLLILGAVSLFRPLSVSEGIGRVGFPALFLCCSLFLLVSKRGGIRKKEGFLLLAFYTFFLLWLFGILK